MGRTATAVAAKKVRKSALPSGIAASTSQARLAALAVVYPDVWASTLDLKVDAKNFSTNGRDYIVPVMRDKSDEIIIKKAAQMGFTVAVILKSLHGVVEKKWHHLYLMPYKNGAITFVQGRIDPMIDSNPLLSSKFKRVENRTHKQTAEAINLYVRGTNVVTELREIPVDCLVLDERDKMVEEHLTEAFARMDGSKIGKVVQLSTPTAPGHGIDSDENWNASDQNKWEIPCPHCGRFQILSFDENVKVGDSSESSVLECSNRRCRKPITDNERWDANTRGRWVPQFLDGRKRGYHISQLNSPTKTFINFIQGYFDGKTNSARLRGFYNNGLGEPYAGSGDKFTPELLDACVVYGHRLRTIPQGPIFIGVDVGNALHLKASYLGRGDKRVLWDVRILTSFEQLDKYLSSLHNFTCVIDANPEKHKAREMCEKYKGKVWLGFERDQATQSDIAVFHDPKKRGEVGTVVIDRTMGFDQLISEYERGNYVLPPDARELGEHLERRDYNGFYAHHFEMVRIEQEDSQGRIIARWKKTRNPDHWHHADLFESIAFMKRPPLRVPANISAAFNQAGSLVGA